MSSEDTFEDDGSARPRLHAARSYTQIQSSGANPFARSRSKTMQAGPISENGDSEPMPLPLPLNGQELTGSPDVFEKSDPMDTNPGDEGEEGSFISRSLQGEPVELPIELISLTDRFVGSLNAKVHSSPPTMDRISNMFQDFYARADSHIATHISALASRINREPSPHSSPENARGATQTKANAKGGKAVTSRQMLTAVEVAERRKARRFLARKRVALEEAVERRACESIYDKIWRHRSTLDEVRDEKLRSKTAALSLVGTDLKELGVDIDLAAVDEEKQQQTNECLATARECLIKMNDEKYPLGKLQHLAAAYKAIVDALTKLIGSSASADEILPTLIYCLINCPPEGINIISNLSFVQHFRSSSKIDGETAYCLTNLEAAVSFLENIELSTLRTGETPDSHTLPPSDATAALEKSEFPRLAQEGPVSSVTPASASPEFLKPPTQQGIPATLPRPAASLSPQQRRLSNLFQPPAKVLGAANDAVRNTADQGLKNIGATLDSSLNFVFGRLKELQANHQGSGVESLPKTLAEARRLVANPADGDKKTSAQEDNLLRGETPPTERTHRPSELTTEERLRNIMSGGKSSRDRSTDSVRTQSSSTTTTLSGSLLKDEAQTPGSLPPGPSTPITPLESMKNFGTSFNPLSHIPGMIRNLGRNPTDPPTPSHPSPEVKTATADKTRLQPTPAKEASRPTGPKPDPPIQRFLDIKDVHDLKIGDISLLLEDYKRLAGVLFGQGAGQDST
ncbi:hypothetical protein ASPZODRAFT_152149 [Penicilliopsis zonata CBS 506.65]|uniref:VPS9 domain-containing protein n=1 Tax=Penicilliopsis zonata CBS 506.65 TaxID=1073090 RepID=A0A1L9SHV6_9EURO|nr:hypothetical protein ASPZODRAFT_152149 [Penicilliopsis zonata CBS 506.65]OJJ46717.1 hypothetical protein ASPZODRAFT_152149 [Penicilliopsis zonata CBS 506.65]